MIESHLMFFTCSFVWFSGHTKRDGDGSRIHSTHTNCNKGEGKWREQSSETCQKLFETFRCTQKRKRKLSKKKKKRDVESNVPDSPNQERCTHTHTHIKNEKTRINKYTHEKKKRRENWNWWMGNDVTMNFFFFFFFFSLRFPPIAFDWLANCVDDVEERLPHLLTVAMLLFLFYSHFPFFCCCCCSSGSILCRSINSFSYSLLFFFFSYF